MKDYVVDTLLQKEFKLLRDDVYAKGDSRITFNKVYDNKNCLSLKIDTREYVLNIMLSSYTKQSEKMDLDKILNLCY